jgi:predicted flap endonuclease-1-like 5' DNA nuclease
MLLIVGAAVLLLALLLLLLARTGRKPVEGPADQDGIAMVRPATELSPVLPDEPLPEPAATLAPALSVAEVAAVPDAVGPADPLTRMKGLGPKAQALLAGMGVTRFDQIAAWTDADIVSIDAGMGAFKGRIVRDRWTEQARYLAEDDVAGFEAVFGKLG